MIAPNPTPTAQALAEELRAGEEVFVRIRNTQGDLIEPQRRAILMRHEPYVHSRGQVVTEGWYVQYPDARESWDCHGGWVQARFLIPAALVRGHESAVGVLAAEERSE